MKFEMDLSEPLVRKLRALNLLVGGDPKTLPDFVAQLVDKAVSAAIVQEVSGDLPAEELPPRVIRAWNASGSALRAGQPVVAARPQAAVEDVSGISAGLGDEEEVEVAGETDPMAMVPKRGAIKADELEGDMTVEDPGHEAKTEAPGKTDPGKRAEEEFAAILNIDPPAMPEPAAAKNRGKRRVDTRRVTGFTGHERSAF